MKDSEIQKLHLKYGRFLSSQVNSFIHKNQLKNIDFIASHGHTIFHRPEEKYTFQIGDGQVIANETQHQVVCDFRTQDVKLGGQGAPLVPIGDQLLFSEYQYCLNLGGFANISFENSSKERIAFDICPVNVVLNAFAQKLGFSYDNNGELAREGIVNQEMLDQLNRLAFYTTKPPKSLGVEWVQENIFPILNDINAEPKHVLRTFVEHIGYQIGNYLSLKGPVLVTGGGVYNSFLMNRIQHYAKANVVKPSDDLIEFKEALIFAFLGYLKINGKNNCLASVTGAIKDHSSGEIFYPKSI